MASSSQETKTPESVKSTADSLELVPESVKTTPESVKMTPDSMKTTPDSVKTTLDSLAEESQELVPNSVEEMVPDSVVDMVLGSAVEEMAPDSVVVLCPRCSTYHAGGVFGEECYEARRNARRCARCGLLHEDYDIPSQLLHGQDRFDCEIFIPNVDELVLRGNTIILPDHAKKRLQEDIDKRHAAKKRKKVLQ